jgi:hypothetical protein
MGKGMLYSKVAKKRRHCRESRTNKKHNDEKEISIKGTNRGL